MQPFFTQKHTHAHPRTQTKTAHLPTLPWKKKKTLAVGTTVVEKASCWKAAVSLHNRPQLQYPEKWKTFPSNPCLIHTTESFRFKTASALNGMFFVSDPLKIPYEKVGMNEPRDTPIFKNTHKHTRTYVLSCYCLAFRIPACRNGQSEITSTVTHRALELLNRIELYHY